MKSSPQVEQPIIVAGACSPVDRMYVTAKPGVMTLIMAENHTKKSSGVRYQAECCYEQEDSSTSMTQPLFPCTIGTQSRFAWFLTIKTVVRKFGKSDGQTGSRCSDKARQCLQGGGGGLSVISETLCSKFC